MTVAQTMTRLEKTLQSGRCPVVEQLNGYRYEIHNVGPESLGVTLLGPEPFDTRVSRQHFEKLVAADVVMIEWN
ncbi:hypothetical protein [Anatilimnocola floriformis]|uniref:hypothetical protein n=1 Tax=Anatilimnocola floriformis TaxID=2948575 RepID=UPI0020C3F136|nr:hypothetical protein [Anatilimnocola floriformis]